MLLTYFVSSQNPDFDICLLAKEWVMLVWLYLTNVTLDNWRHEIKPQKLLHSLYLNAHTLWFHPRAKTLESH